MNLKHTHDNNNSSRGLKHPVAIKQVFCQYNFLWLLKADDNKKNTYQELDVA